MRAEGGGGHRGAVDRPRGRRSKGSLPLAPVVVHELLARGQHSLFTEKTSL